VVKPEKKEIGFSFPLFATAVTGTALLVFLVPSLSGRLIYDRTEIAQGEVWRLFTGSLVHFSPSHLFFNLLVFGVVGWAISNRGYPGFRVFCILSAGLIGTTLYALRPDLAQYGGLSGVACGAVVYLALYGLAERGAWKALCAGVLLVTACKILLEYRLGHFLFVNSADPAFVSAPLSHAVGSLTAVMVFWLVKGARWVTTQNCYACCAGGTQTMKPREEER
jgi:rhomboid family GlyGly-CTERM serine protease